MATNRIRRTRKMIPEVKPAEIHYLKTGDDSQARDDLKFEMFVRTDADWEKIWETVREEILAEWIKKAPCTRPFAWWSWTAPRWTRRFPGWYFDGKLPEPRRRLGGVGTEDFEVLNIVPDFQKGLPTGWVSKFDEEYYNGRAKDIHGNIIPTRYKEGDFSGKAIDPKDPPRFESEAAYLERHGLLTEAEKKYLSNHAELLEPEILRFEDD